MYETHRYTASNTLFKADLTMLREMNSDISQMSTEDIKRLVSDFRIRLIELELENEKFQRAQFDLTESLDHYLQLFDFSPVGYLVLNDDGIILEVNQTLAQMLGTVRTDMVNRSIAEYVHPDDLNIYESFLHGFSKHVCMENFTIRVKNSEGEYILIRLQGNACQNNQASQELLVSISEIQESEETSNYINNLNQIKDHQTIQLDENNSDLNKSIRELGYLKKDVIEKEAKLDSIFNAAIEGIIIIDESGKIVSVNKAMGDIFGYSETQLSGSSLNNLTNNKNKKKDAFKEYFLNSKHITPKIIELDGKHKNGSLIPIDLTISEFKIGDMCYYTAIFRDVSQRKIKEREDKEHLDELAHVTRLGLMGEMASGIAHELNQPLTAISSYLEACLMFTSSTNPKENKLLETIQKAKQQALRAGQIIHRIRNFVKLRKMEKTPVNINDLVDEAMGLCEIEFKQHGIICKKELDNHLPIINIDKVHIEQVLLNLMKNSVEALSKLPKEKKRNVIIQTYLDNQNKNQIEVRVKDNGSGLLYEEKKNILKPFFTTKESGMGMGLSISRSIIESHQGSLRFNSKKGKGSTFYFTLPVMEGRNDIQEQN